MMHDVTGKKSLWLAVVLGCAIFVGGCGKPNHYVLDNGMSIEVYRHRDGRVRGISLRDDAGREVLAVGVDYESGRTRRVSFFDQDRKKIDETVFAPGRISDIAGPILGELRTESGPAGVSIKRLWTYKNEYLVYSEELEIGHDRRLLSKVVRGPYGFLLEEYPPTWRSNSKQRP